jgi:hypothetical protein
MPDRYHVVVLPCCALTSISIVTRPVRQRRNVHQLWVRTVLCTASADCMQVSCSCLILLTLRFVPSLNTVIAHRASLRIPLAAQLAWSAARAAIALRPRPRSATSVTRAQLSLCLAEPTVRAVRCVVLVLEQILLIPLVFTQVYRVTHLCACVLCMRCPHKSEMEAGHYSYSSACIRFAPHVRLAKQVLVSLPPCARTALWGVSRHQKAAVFATRVYQVSQ